MTIFDTRSAIKLDQSSLPNLVVGQQEVKSDTWKDLHKRVTSNSSDPLHLGNLAAFYSLKSLGPIPRPVRQVMEMVKYSLVQIAKDFDLDFLRDKADFTTLRHAVNQIWDNSGLKCLDKSLSFKEVEIEPGATLSEESRSTISLLSRYSFNPRTKEVILSKTPIIPSNMRSVVNTEFATKVADLGIIPISHWLPDQEGRTARLEYLEATKGYSFVTIRSNTKEIEFGQELLRKGVRGICLEMANAFSPRAVKGIRALREVNNEAHIVLGNIATPQGALFAWLLGAVAKVGRGSGAACTTPEVTGMGVRQMSANLNVGLAQSLFYILSGEDPIFWSDGGASQAADVIKAGFAGAEQTMMGKTFCATEESAAEKIDVPELQADNTSISRRYARYFGEASAAAKEKDGNARAVATQGKDGWIPVTGSVADLVSRLNQGLQASIADGDALNFQDFVAQATSEGLVIESIVAKNESGTRLEKAK